MSYRVPVAVAAFGLTVVFLLLTAAPSPAPTAPRNCGMIEVRSKDYQIKADQIRCSRAKSWARTYLRSGDKPSRYRCKNYGSDTALKFRCKRGQRVFFAIRR